MTESTNINSLADHHIWSTIKTLPAPLSEPSSMDRGLRTGVTGGVSLSDLDLIKGGGAAGRGRWVVDRGPWLMDWQRRFGFHTRWVQKVDNLIKLINPRLAVHFTDF